MFEETGLPARNRTAAPIKQDASKAKRYAQLALTVFMIAESVSTLKFILTRGLAYNQIALWSSLEALIFWWILPVLMLYKVERRDWRSLGLSIQREKRWIYVLAAGIGLVLPAFLVGFDRLLLVEFVEQILYIGFIEELFYRGYLLQRMCGWLGDVRGLLITSFLFGLGHILSRLTQKGFTILGPASLLGFQTFLGGLLFGFIYLRARNIWPSAILHISMNMYLGRMMELLS